MPASKLRTAAAALAAVAAAATMTATDANAAMQLRAPATTVHPAVTVSAITVAPTDPSDKDQASRCAHWNNYLQGSAAFQLKIEGSVSTQPTTNPQTEEAANEAMDDGCMVIY